MKPNSPLTLLSEKDKDRSQEDPAANRREPGPPGPPMRRRWYDDARVVWRGSNLLRVATVLHSLGQPAYMHVIASKAGLTPEDTGKALSRLYKKDFLSREKNSKSGVASYYKWSMSDEQFDAYLTSAALTTQHIDTELRSVFAKIRLLQRLKDSTVFGNNPVLDSMIEDYRGVWRAFNEREEQKKGSK